MKVWCVDCEKFIDTETHNIMHKWDFTKKLKHEFDV